MSAERRHGSQDMFHIKYPERRDFLSWVELGCLARALGFPKDIVRQHITDEVHAEEGGISIQQLQRMIELKLLHQSLHRSFNMHTADWNLCVIKKAIRLLQHCVLNFEELQNIRIAYATYEASDMKGLKVDKRTLLRTLKMCHRTISPLKLMHRVKHMRNKLEEAGRIQLYEFLDLIMWCDYMESLNQTEQVKAEGKENDLYHLVDFEKLLSHQDARRARVLDERYLAEEWDFGRERLGSKHMFRGEVVYTEGRIKQTQAQTRKYRHLKSEINQSQRRVYRAHAGSIRARPISAPNLSMYATPRDIVRAGAASAGDMYKSVQRRLHSAPSRASKVDVTDRPQIQEYVRVQTPRVVTPNELDEVQLKIETLQFDICTLESRCQIQMEEEKNFYIPGYERRPTPKKSELPEKPPKMEHWTPEIIQNLAYPQYHLPPHHAETCDARFRGWRMTQRRGRHKILIEPTYISSPKARLLAKQRSATLAPVAYMRPDYVIRYTPKGDVTAEHDHQVTRPSTAPAASPRTKPVKRIGTRSADNIRTPAELPSHDGTAGINAAVQKDDVKATVHEALTNARTQKDRSTEAWQNANGNSGSTKQQPVAVSASHSTSTSSSQVSSSMHHDQQRKDSADVRPKDTDASAGSKSFPKAKRAVGQETSEDDYALTSTSLSYSRQKRAKTMDMGQMGIITLLESIQEQQDLEDNVSDVEKTSPREDAGLSKSKNQAPASTEVSKHATHVNRTTTNNESHSKTLTKEVLDELAQQFEEASNRNSSVLISKKPPPFRPRQDGGMHEDGEVKDTIHKRADQSYCKNSQYGKINNSHAAGGQVSKTPDSLSDDEEHTPLASTTVTIKDKKNHMTNTSMREARDHVGTAEFTDGQFHSSPFAGSSPYSTSTPRRVQSPVKLSNRRKIQKENHTIASQDQNKANHFFSDQSAPSTINLQSLTSSSSHAVQGRRESNTDSSKDKFKNGDQAPGETERKNIQFAPDTLDPQPSSRPSLQHQTSTERLLRLKDYLDQETPRRFTFNKVTTSRLLQRVQNEISPELKMRIVDGNTGLKVA